MEDTNKTLKQVAPDVITKAIANPEDTKAAAKKEKKAETYIVETPVKDYCGIGAGGIQFAYGKAEVHAGTVLDWFKEHGYKVTKK